MILPERRIAGILQQPPAAAHIVGDGGQRLVELVSQGGRHRAHRAQPRDVGELGAQPPYRRFRLAPFALAVLEIGVGGLELIGEPLLLLDRRQHGERSAVKLHADGEEQLGRGKGGEAEDDIIEIAGEDQAPGQRAIDRHGPAECDAGAEMIAKAGGGGAERDHDQRQVDERIVRRQRRPRGHEAHPGDRCDERYFDDVGGRGRAEQLADQCHIDARRQRAP